MLVLKWPTPTLHLIVFKFITMQVLFIFHIIFHSWTDGRIKRGAESWQSRIVTWDNGTFLSFLYIRWKNKTDEWRVFWLAICLHFNKVGRHHTKMGRHHTIWYQITCMTAKSRQPTPIIVSPVFRSRIFRGNWWKISPSKNWIRLFVRANSESSFTRVDNFQRLEKWNKSLQWRMSVKRWLFFVNFFRQRRWKWN